MLKCCAFSRSLPVSLGNERLSLEQAASQNLQPRYLLQHHTSTAISSHLLFSFSFRFICRAVRGLHSFALSNLFTVEWAWIMPCGLGKRRTCLKTKTVDQFGFRISDSNYFCTSLISRVDHKILQLWRNRLMDIPFVFFLLPIQRQQHFGIISKRKGTLCKCLIVLALEH